jgi:hypothetical protein
MIAKMSDPTQTRIEELLGRITEITLDLDHEVQLLKATLELKTDYAGVCMRVGTIVTKGTNLMWLAGQMEALRSMKYL